MKIKKISKIKAEKVSMEGAKDDYMKILIGPNDGSKNIIMRHFTVLPSGHTPLHTHNFEHLVKIEKGKGIAIDENGKKYDIKKGDVLFVDANKEHQFQNAGESNFEFLCIILNQFKCA